MAFLAVISLMRTVELQFLHPQPRIILTNKEQIKSLHEKLGHLLVFLEECEKKGNNCAEMKELIDKIRKVSVKAEDDIEAELLNVHHLQRVVEDIEELMQTTRNTNHHLVNNLTLGDPSQPTSNVVEDNAMVGHSEELDEVKSQLFRDKRWLSVKVVNPHFHLAIASRKCRTIVCFNMVGNCDYEWYLLANSFKKLRVLDLSKINFSSGMPPDITQLVFLRYLEIASSKVLNCIPLWKNWNLQTLIVTEDDNGARRLPPGIWDLPQLRHLEINHQVPIVGLPKMVQENLQTLYWLSTSQCTMEVFMRIPNVKDLRIIARCQVSSSQGLNDNLKCLNHLEKLRVRGSYHPLHLPSQGDIFPQNLKELTFERTLIPWEAMTIISLLPNLEILKLKNFACVGQEWQLIEEGSFPQLKVLLISLTNLKEWKAYVESPFPNLEHLLLRNCFELKEMPEWIADIITLQLIKLRIVILPVTSAMTVKEDQLDNYGNDKLDVLDFHTRPGYRTYDSGSSCSVQGSYSAIRPGSWRVGLNFFCSAYWRPVQMILLLGYRVEMEYKGVATGGRLSWDVQKMELWFSRAYLAYLVFKPYDTYLDRVDPRQSRPVMLRTSYNSTLKDSWENTEGPVWEAEGPETIIRKRFSAVCESLERIGSGRKGPLEYVNLADEKRHLGYLDLGLFTGLGGKRLTFLGTLPFIISLEWDIIRLAFLSEFYVVSRIAGLRLRHTKKAFWVHFSIGEVTWSVVSVDLCSPGQNRPQQVECCASNWNNELYYNGDKVDGRSGAEKLYDIEY
nr:putative late blight resistance protein homolog R1B-17 [Ipomoea batatas]